VRASRGRNADIFCPCGAVMNNPVSFTRIAAIVAMLILPGCGDLTRSEVERILNGEGRGHACVTELGFLDDGFEKAKAGNTISFIPSESGFLGSTFKVADLPDGDRWQVIFLGFEKNPNITRKTKNKLCLPGKVEVLTLADAPFAPPGGSYKIVEYVEVVALPSELERVRPYVYTRYRKQTVFQKTDRGWRVAR
jgi:hypothetical protein